ncbi:MAG TPA: phosphoadenylyl-sulfate reductase [Oleiagrimonas sp.]|nr:phosphoadenylyl-sulfate reductase [Oleiagrimonas sp.]
MSLAGSAPTPAADHDDINAMLAALNADERVHWALDNLPGPHVLSSSFGAQAAVMLHLVTRQQPDTPVIVIDTGYLFAETYRFIDELRERLDLNLHIAHPASSRAWLEARHDKLWEQGAEGLEQYNQLAKVEPMQRKLAELNAATWFAGLRRDQSVSRAHTPFIEQRHGRWKVHPIADWSDRDIGLYLKQHELPYHPLWDQGYVSIGDTHTTRRWHPGMREEDTRFFGLKRECGLHLDV